MASTEITTTTTDLSVPPNQGPCPAKAYLAELGSKTSTRSMVSALNSMAEILIGKRNWQGVHWARAMNAAIVSALFQKIEGAPATRNKALSALKGIARAAFRLEQISADQYARIREIRGDKGKRLPRGRDLKAIEVKALLDACKEDEGPAGYRDGAMIALAASTGSRRSEVASLQMESLVESGDGFTLTVIGKGNRERTLYIHNGAAIALSEWLEIRDSAEGPVFCRILKGGHLRHEEAISSTALDNILRKRALQADVQGVTWHDFRRTVAGDLMDLGVDISTVAGMLGHASITTTQAYDRRGERAKKRAANMLEIPYSPRSNLNLSSDDLNRAKELSI